MLGDFILPQNSAARNRLILTLLKLACATHPSCLSRWFFVLAIRLSPIEVQRDIYFRVRRLLAEQQRESQNEH